MKIIRIAFFDTKHYDTETFTKAATLAESKLADDSDTDDSALDNSVKFEMDFYEGHLTETSAVFAQNHDVVCIFSNDQVTKRIAEILIEEGVQIIALRSVGYNNVDMNAIKAINAESKRLQVVHVPSYSEHSTAEFAVALLQALNRKIPKAYARTRDGFFSTENLMGVELYGKTVGIIGAGKIGKVAAEIFKGYGAKVLLNAAHQDPAFGQKIDSEYVNLEEIFKNSNFIMLFCPLVYETRHIINDKCISLMKKDALIVNIGRGSLIDTNNLFDALNTGRIRGVAFDIFEEDKQNLYGDDWAPSPIRDESFEKLLRLPNVLMTHHQAYLTAENLMNIATVTLDNIRKVMNGDECENLIN
ncbi:MAG: 2-hydroxyacid dehydrogenase [Treponema sp.]|nr:2-hydroxyacid dehydrogenase [Treponema sp.]MBR6914195.1 2-hydroxyacid dehydrogenase [Treponema sp.]